MTPHGGKCRVQAHCSGATGTGEITMGFLTASLPRRSSITIDGKLRHQTSCYNRSEWLGAAFTETGESNYHGNKIKVEDNHAHQKLGRGEEKE